MSKRLSLAFILLIFAASPALAYVGPGVSLGAVGVALGFAVAAFLTIFSFIWHPVKLGWRYLRRMLGRNRARGRSKAEEMPSQAQRQ